MKMPGEQWAAAPSEVSRVATHGTEIGYETCWISSGVLDFFPVRISRCDRFVSKDKVPARAPALVLPLLVATESHLSYIHDTAGTDPPGSSCGKRIRRSQIATSCDNRGTFMPLPQQELP